MSADGTPATPDVRGPRTMALEALVNVVGFLLPLGTISVIGAVIRGVAEWLDERTGPAAALVFVLFCALTWLWVIALVEPSHVRGKDGKIRGGFVLGFAGAASMVWIYIFGALSYLLLKLDAMTVAIMMHPDEPLSDLTDAFLWYFLDLIPVLRMNEALGWSPDVEFKGGLPGLVLLVFRVVIVFQVFALTKRMLSTGRQPEIAAQ